MVHCQPDEYYTRALASSDGSVDYELAAAIFDTAKHWAMLAERLMFALEVSGLLPLAPSLVSAYESACLEEPKKFADSQCPLNAR
jgi:hypothetical protein